MTTVPVYLEVGSKRVFACSLEWPGWCRSGKSENAALEALAAYGERYASVARSAGVNFPVNALSFEVIERVVGGGTTDFGAPGRVATADHEPLTGAAASRLARLLRAAWGTLADIASAAPPVLPKGPRGGGRDRDEIVEHVLASEASYARTIGVRLPQPPIDDPVAIGALRDAIVAALQKQEAPDTRWPPRYTCRRMAWHVLDHAWEIEDKSDAIR